MALPPPDMAGFLEKVGGKFVSRNQTRYFELRGMNLYYYKGKPAPGESPQGAVDLADTKIVDNPKEKFSFIIGGPKLKKEYVLCASNDAEKKAWIEHLQNPIASNTTTVKTTGGDDDDEDNADGRMFFSSKAGAKKVSTDDFQIVRVIGKGSFGKVMEVRKKDTGETFAMKEMSKDVIERENLLEHIFAEKSILQKIDHPFIVQLHFAFQTKDKLYLILDFLSGGELFFHLSQDGKFDEWRAKFYAAEIGLALGHLHKLDIIYRDLKPENLLLDNKGHIKITDFGFAKKVPERTFTLCGTPEYLAPEVIQSKGHGKAVDWWTMGILLYEFIAGYPPFFDDSPFRIYEKILEGKVKFPNWFDSRARDLVKGLLMIDHTKRLGTLKNGVADIKGHPYFHGANWDKLFTRHYPAPIPVKVKSAGDTSNFESYPESGEDRSAPLTPQQQAEFKDF